MIAIGAPQGPGIVKPAAVPGKLILSTACRAAGHYSGIFARVPIFGTLIADWRPRTALELIPQRGGSSQLRKLGEANRPRSQKKGTDAVIESY
jgi:hypothetical protein